MGPPDRALRLGEDPEAAAAAGRKGRLTFAEAALGSLGLSRVTVNAGPWRGGKSDTDNLCGRVTVPLRGSECPPSRLSCVSSPGDLPEVTGLGNSLSMSRGVTVFQVTCGASCGCLWVTCGKQEEAQDGGGCAGAVSPTCQPARPWPRGRCWPQQAGWAGFPAALAASGALLC